MNANVDLFYNTYANFNEQVLAAVREETFGQDIGQNSWLTAEEFEQFIGWLDIDAGSHLLEVASGSGGPALHLADKHGCRVTGVDVNPHGVATARRAAVAAGLTHLVKFKVADATEALPFVDDRFDGLMCIDSMNHFPDRRRGAQGVAPRAEARRARRVHRPRGRHRAGDQRGTGAAQLHRTVRVRAARVNEELIAQAGFRILRQLDVTENAVLVSRRWREARQRFSADLLRIEGQERFDGVQKFLAVVHRLTSERRLSRIAYLVEK